MTLQPTSQPPPRVREALLACYQRALGHEFPSRFVGIQGLLRLLELEAAGRLDTEMRDYLTQCADLARRAHALTRELADLGRSLRNPGKIQPVSVGEAVREAFAEARQIAREVPMECEIDSSLDTLTVPWPDLVAVFVRLIQHLIQVHRASVAVSEFPLRIQVSGQADSNGVTIRLYGNVPTPPAQQLTQFFEPFLAPASGATSELGLFPVRLLVESWGGSVSVAVEEGLLFTLTVP